MFCVFHRKTILLTAGFVLSAPFACLAQQQLVVITPPSLAFYPGGTTSTDTFTIGASSDGQLVTGVPVLLTSDSPWLLLNSDCSNGSGAFSVSVETTATVSFCTDPSKVPGGAAGYYVGLIQATVPFGLSYAPVTFSVKVQNFPLGDFTVDPPKVTLSASQTIVKVKISKPPDPIDQSTAAGSGPLTLTAQIGQSMPEGNWLQYTLTNPNVALSAPGEIQIQVNPAVTLTSPTPLTYTHTVVITDQDNNVDGITVSYTVPAQSQVVQPVRSFAHIAPQPDFATQLILTNTSGQAAAITLKLLHDNGSPFSLPVTTTSGTQMLDTITDSIPANGTNYYDLSGAAAGSGNSSGSAQLTAPDSVTGVALFRNVPDSTSYFEAAVPLSAGATSFVVPFDLTTSNVTNKPFVTGFAVANLDGTKAASVNCTARGSTGSLIPNASLSLSLQPNGHYASGLPAAFNGTRGALTCTSTAPVSAISLRFQGNEFTTLPAVSFP